jgi:hypothetical protein
LLRALAANILLIQEPFRLGIFQGPISGCAHALVRLAVAVGAGCSFPLCSGPGPFEHVPLQRPLGVVPLVNA